MNLRDYLVGIPVTLRSPLTPEEIGRRIKDETRTSLLSMPFRTGPVGGVHLGWLRLRFASSIFEYNAKPILTGTVRRLATETVLQLDYRCPLWMRLFLVAWYPLLALFGTIFLAVGTDPPLRGAERLAPFAILVLLLVAPIGMHLVGTRNADAELKELLEFLEHVAEARQEIPVLQPPR